MPAVNALDHVRFPGLNISRADFVFTHGVSPSACIVSCIPQNTQFTIGNLIYYSNGVPIMMFRDCAIDHQFTNPPMVKRGQRVVMRLLDRRWRWKGKLVDGRYNVRRPDGLPRPATKKSYYDLIVLLLKALGETAYQISIPYPNLDGPTVNWAGARADLELGKIVDEIGCVVVLGLDNIVRIVRDGQGGLWPPNGREREPLVEFFPSAVPYWVDCKFGPNKYQSKLLLEAVGLDRDGVIKPIDKLLYKPTGGWATQVPGIFNDVTNESDRELARRTVYFWYRVKCQWNDTLTLPGGREKISTIDDILPLLPYLIMPQPKAAANPNSFDNWPPSRPTLEGFFFNSDLTGLPEQGELGVGSYAKWDSEFELDLEHGLVKLLQPAYFIDLDGHQSPATLYLECAYQARANAAASDWYWWQRIRTGQVTEDGAGAVQVDRPDLFRYFVVRYYDNSNSYRGLTTNTPVITTHGRQQAESYRYHYTNYPHSCMQWAGIIPIPVQGNIHQMRWVLGDGPPMTYGARSCEVHTWGPSRYERRLREEAERNMRSLRR